MAKSILSHPVLYPLIILILGLLAYANTFGVPFTLDDLTSISENQVIKDIANYFPGGSGYDFVPRRWFGYLTFALNYHLGGLDVTGYHAVNLAIHLGTALLVYALVLLTFRTPHLISSRLLVHARTVALFSALLFVAHPVQTQAVTYLAQRLTSLCTFFYLSSLVCYVAARLRADASAKTGTGKKESQGQWQTILLYAASVTAALLATQTKEIAFTLPLAAILYELSFFRGEWKQRALSLLPLLLTLPIIPLSVLFGDSADPLAEGSSVDEQLRASTDIPRLHYLFTQLRVIVTYLRLLVLPTGQNLDYDYPVYSRFFTPPVVLSFLLLMALLGLAFYLHHRSRVAPAASLAPTLSRDPAMRLISFGIFWFFLGLSVESSFVPIFDVIFEHRLYLPSIGLFAAFVTLVLLTAEKTAAILSGRIKLVVASLVIIVLAVATFQRNSVWGSNVRLWEDVVRKSPNKVRPWYNYGSYLSDAGRYDESIRVLSRAVQLDPQHSDAWHNLGRAHILNGSAAMAVPALRKAVRIMPDLDNAVVNLAVALIHTGNSAEAAQHLEGVRRRFPSWPEVRLNLGLAYLRSGNLAAAKSELAVLYRLAPHLTPSLAEQIKGADAAK